MAIQINEPEQTDQINSQNQSKGTCLIRMLYKHF